jgi:hypothetical protein
MKKFFSLVLIVFAVATIVELNSCKLCGDLPPARYFRIVSFQNYIVKGEMDSIRENDTVSYRDLKMSIYADSLLYVINKSRSTFSFINTAFACSPVIPSAVNSITRIQIYSDKDLTDIIPAGRDISPYFSASYAGTIAIASKVTNLLFFQGDVNLFLKGLPQTLIGANFNKTYHQFRVKLDFSDNTTQTFTFNRIYLTI